MSLLDDTIKGSVDLERFSVGLKNKATKLLNQTQKEVFVQIAMDNPTLPKVTKWKRKRLVDLNKNLSGILKDGYNTVQKEVTKDLKVLSKISAGQAVKNLNDSIGMELVNVTLTNNDLNAIVNNTLLEGRTLKNWWPKSLQTTKDRLSAGMSDVMQSIQRGAVQGESMGQLVKRAKDIWKTTTREATALVHTSAMTVYNESRQKMFEQNADVLSGYQVLATLDSRTTPLCRGLDNRLYNLDFEPKPPNTVPLPANAPPPFHWQCRSVLVGITKTYKELLNSKLNNFQKRGLKEFPESQRASLGGPIHGDVSYNTWLKGQPKRTQLDVLGPSRYELWKENKLSMADMIHQNGRPLTIKQLEKKVLHSNFKSVGDPEFLSTRIEEVKIGKVVSKDATPKKKFSVDSEAKFISKTALEGEVKTATKVIPKKLLVIEETPVSKEFMKEVNDALDKIPIELRNHINKRGVKVKTGDLLTNVSPSLKGKIPRGWPEGSTWDGVEGCYSSANKNIIVTEFRKRALGAGEKVKSYRIDYAVGHETGHGIDFNLYKTRRASDKSIFKKAYKKDMKIINEFKDKGYIDIEDISYFIQEGSAGRQETWAEVIQKIYIKSASEAYRTPAFLKYFKNSIKVVQQQIDEIIIGKPIKKIPVPKVKGKITFIDETVSSQSGQIDSRLTIMKNNKTVGRLDYSELNGEPSIKYIDVAKANQRKGYGSKLVTELQSKFPNQEINWGGLTEDGASLYKTIPKYKIPDKLVLKQRKILDDVDKKLKVMEKKANKYAAIEKPTEVQRKAFLKNTEGWNDLQDLKDDLTDKLWGKKDYTTIIGKKPKSIKSYKKVKYKNIPVDEKTSVSKEFRKEVNDALEKIPEKLRNLMNERGVKVQTGDLLTNIKPSLKGKKPRGWPKGSTWDGVEGGFSTLDNNIMISEYKKTILGKGNKVKSLSTDAVTGHETGHSIDFNLYKFERASNKDIFKEAYRKDMKIINGLGPDDAVHNVLSYFKQAGYAGRQETWAEAIQAIYTKSPSRGPSTDLFRKYFKNSVKVVKQQVDEFLYGKPKPVIDAKPIIPVDKKIDLKFKSYGNSTYDAKIGNANIDLWKVKKGDWRAEVNIGKYGTKEYVEPFTLTGQTKTEVIKYINSALKFEKHFNIIENKK